MRGGLSGPSAAAGRRTGTRQGNMPNQNAPKQSNKKKQGGNPNQGNGVNQVAPKLNKKAKKRARLLAGNGGN